MRFTYNHFISPSLYISHINGQKYIVPGFIPVPAETVIEDVDWVNRYETPPNKKLPIAKTKEWYFPSSSTPGTMYTVSIVNNKITCNCPGAWSAKDKKCKHMKSVEKELAGASA